MKQQNKQKKINKNIETNNKERGRPKQQTLRVTTNTITNLPTQIFSFGSYVGMSFHHGRHLETVLQGRLKEDLLRIPLDGRGGIGTSCKNENHRTNKS